MKNSKSIQGVYLSLTLFSTLATSFIWGINTLFLLDAGLSNAEAFAANAFFTLGMVIFEIPTGVVADLWGRKASFLLGTIILLLSTVLYLFMWQIQAGLWGWALSSAILGLGFTFFSGATEAWLVDALAFTGFAGNLEDVFARGQIVNGSAMLVGSVAGGYIAQLTHIGVPYIMRAGTLGITFIIALFFMKDLGFTPEKGVRPLVKMRRILSASLDGGIRNRPVRWVMLMGPFTMGVGMFAFYAMQPYLLELYGRGQAYGIAGLAAAIIAGSQIAGGFLSSLIRRVFSRRTTAIIAITIISSISLIVIGLAGNFWAALGMLVVWAMCAAAIRPVRQTYLNGLISSAERATVLSFDSLISSTGGVVSQPVLGRVADLYGYSASYVVTGLIQILALPFGILARRENPSSDRISRSPRST